MRFTFYIALALLIAGTGVPGIAFAQLPSDVREQLVINASPQYPHPGSSVTLSVNSYQMSVESARIAWRENGVVQRQGVGITEYTTTAGELGSETTITASVSGPDGSATDTHTIRPTRVTLLWEGDTYTPPLYQGAPYHTAGSSVTLTAIPEFTRQDGSRVSPETLVYTWRQGTDVLGQQSGYGAQSITLMNPGVLRDMDIRVDVRTQDSVLRGNAVTTITVSQPTVQLYQQHPLLGTQFYRASGAGEQITEDELTLTAVPYFTSASQAASDALSYTWRINGEEVQPSDSANTVTLRPSGNGDGEANVSVDIQHVRRMLQSASDSLTVSF